MNLFIFRKRIKHDYRRKGARISGGELQRLALARAFYRVPDIIILDEPTSSLDNITEKNILKFYVR